MILTSSKLLTMQYGKRPLNEGAVAFSQGTILAIGPERLIIKKYPSHRIYSFKNAVLMPGLVNVHTHLELPSLLQDIRTASYPEWVMNLLQAKRALKREDYLSAAKSNIQVLIHSGTTMVAEICTHNASPEVLKQSDMRAVVFHEIVSMTKEFNAIRLPGKRVAARLLRYGISPHAPHTVSETTLREINRLSEKLHRPLCMHVAESRDEHRLLQGKRSGMDALYHAVQWDPSWAPRARSSFEYLHRIGILSPVFLAVHAVHVDDQDISLIRRSGAAIAHCPRSNHELGVGKMPLKKFLDADIPVGLGTDSLASSPSLNLWDEMRYAFRIHRQSGITPEGIFQLATLCGARALGMDREIGSLEPGKQADIIAVPLPRRNTGDIYSDLLRETKNCNMSMVNGKIIYKEIAS